MSVRMIRRRSMAQLRLSPMVLAYPIGPSIQFRRETEIGQPALGMGERGDPVHLLVRQFEIEDFDILREPLDARRTRDGGDVLLYEPAQADLRRRLAMRA